MESCKTQSVSIKLISFNHQSPSTKYEAFSTLDMKCVKTSMKCSVFPLYFWIFVTPCHGPFSVSTLPPFTFPVRDTAWEPTVSDQVKFVFLGEAGCVLHWSGYVKMVSYVSRKHRAFDWLLKVPGSIYLVPGSGFSCYTSTGCSL